MHPSIGTESAGIRLAERTPSPLSKTLWGLDWSAILPYTVIDGVVAHASSVDDSSAFIREHYATIFEDSGDSPFATSFAAAKARYYELADFIQFRRGNEVVGLVIGVPEDWGSYYIRSAAVLPQFQGSLIVFRFFQSVLFRVLAEHGVERVGADVAPSNLAMVQIVTRAKFNASGTLLTERWGAHTRFTKFLCSTSERVFLSQFCSGVKYQLRGERARTGHGTSEKGDES